MNFRSRNHFSDFFNRNFIFCDVGARWGLEEPWKSQRNLINVVSFEPDKEEYENLNIRKKQQDIVLPYALCNEEKKLSFNLTKSRGCSSMYQPNLSYLERFPDVERFIVEEKAIVDSTTLDQYILSFPYKTAGSTLKMTGRICKPDNAGNVSMIEPQYVYFCILTMIKTQVILI